MSEITSPFEVNGIPLSVEDAILTAFDAGSVSVCDLVMEDLGKVSNDALFSILHGFRNDIVARMNQRAAGSGDAIAAVADEPLGERLDGVDWDV